ncbi:MAG: Amidohydrolase [Ilumatobacteraceae bacterium]|nr:Amidohydrolase [Ilumatobacteraceae bacterium]MCU1387493.1 Amidohydrolase [Ilumatobacteraceae bacterium]
MTTSTLADEARDHLTGAIDLRRRLHQWPEVGNHLPITRDTVLEALQGLPLDISLHSTTSGFGAMLTGSKPGPTILLRGDMDALPMPEDTGEDFASKVAGTMHACGHDTHTAMLVGAAQMLSSRRSGLAGRVLFMFQPGEEGHHGARHMLDEGLLDVPALADGTASPVTGAFALHITSAMPTGMVSIKGGALMASSDHLLITVHGRGGHASEPHRALDPIPVACEIVTAMQTMVTRSIDVFDPTIITVGRISAGTTNNVIPENAQIEGTIRAVSEATRKKVHAGIQRVAEGIAAAHDTSVTVELTLGYPVTSNHNGFSAFATDVAGEVVGANRVRQMPHPMMGAEDFSYVLEAVPGSMMFLGGTAPDRNPSTAAPNHSNRVVFDEQAMVTGMAIYTAVAVRHLETTSPR